MPHSPQIDLSIVVATKNRAPLLKQMLTSIRQGARELSYETLVIEGGSSDGTPEVLKEFGSAQVIDEASVLGSGRHSWPQLYNVGFQKARGTWTIFASDDITFGDHCFDTAIKSLNAAPPSVAGGIFFYRNEVAEQGWERFGIDFLARDLPLLNYGLVRRDILSALGNINTDYQFYCADGDLTYLLASRGMALSPLSNCFVTHHNLLDTQKQINLQGLEKDSALFRSRWASLGEGSRVYPRRMIFEEELATVFSLPMRLILPVEEFNKLWKTIALVQWGEFELAAAALQQLTHPGLPNDTLELLIRYIREKLQART